MSFEGHPNYRWVKMYRGQRYRVTCAELGLAEENWTKDGSYQDANEWWENKVTEAAAANLTDGQRVALESVDRQLGWAAANAPNQLEHLRQHRRTIETLSPDADDIPFVDEAAIAANIETAQLMGVTVPSDLDPLAARMIFGDGRLWADRLQRSAKVKADRTVKHQLSEFLTFEKVDAKPQTFRELKIFLEKVRDDSGCLPPEMSVDAISEQTVTKHYKWLGNQPWTNATKNKALGFFRRFIHWLYTENILDKEPRNLKLKSHRFANEHKEVQKRENVKAELDLLEGRCRLWALLGLNCGMTSVDLGSLNWNMIDKRKGTLTRRRVKTGAKQTTPTVTYKLWTETLEALMKLPTTDGLVFLTPSGSPMYTVRFEGDMVKKKDLFSTYWNRQKQKASYPLKTYRSIAATLMNTHEDWRPYVEYFLAHAPSSQAEKSYAGESDKPFFKALDYVHREIFGDQPTVTA